jgi:methionine-rich copper-binding protein CopC
MWAPTLTAAVTALATAPAAHAHAVLVAIEPASGAVVRTSPPQILLRFHGRVESRPGAVGLLDAAGRSIGLGAIARPAADAVEVPVARQLQSGTYTVVWHLTTTASHPVDGRSSFSVGAPSRVLGGGPFLLLICAGAAAALAVPLAVAARSTRRRAVVVLGAVVVVGLPFAGYAFAARRPTSRAANDYFTTATRLGPFGLEVGVSPDAVGTNTIDLFVSDGTGRPVELTGISVSALHAHSTPRRFQTERLAPGHFVVDLARLQLAGVWRLHVDVRRGSSRFAHTIELPLSS